MTADAWHTLSDTLTSLVVILGFWISGRPKDEEHPFGHGRAKVIAAVVIATLLAVVGASFFRDSIRQLIERKNAAFSTLSLIIFSISVLVKEALARFSLWAGKKTQSQSLVAD
jgi:cation diffusion facilitator family transporter